MPTKSDRELARQNFVLNRFEAMLRQFAREHRIQPFEAMNVLITSAVHNLGHAEWNNDEAFERQVVAVVERLRATRDEHKSRCNGKPH